MKTKVIRLCLAALAATAVLPASATAQEWPTKPVTIIVPFPAGGTSDNLTRTLGQKLSESLGQPVVVENKPGGGTMIGTDALARSKPDGYTIGIVANSFAINPSLQQNMRYDSVKDFVPVARIAYTPHMLVASPEAKVNTLDELIARAKKEPGALTFASFGTGTSPHIAIEMLKAAADIDVVHVPYQGQAPALTDLLGGHVNFMFGNLPDVLPHVQDGKLRAIALSDDQRAETAADVPTFTEAGLKDFDSNSWFGVLAPAGTPDAVVQRLSQEINTALAQPDVKERLLASGLQPTASTPDEFAAYIKAEMDKANRLVKSSGATAY